MNDCLFCKIVRKEIPAKICGESAKALAFYDIQPKAPLHLLVIPKEHITSALHVEESHGEVVKDMILLAQKCAQEEKVTESGFRLVMNVGKDAGQSVDHLHMHLLGKRKLAWPPG